MRTVVVSAYYVIPSKKPHSEYKEYLKRWFRSIRCPTLFFTSADLLADLQSLVPPLSTNIQWRVLELCEWHAWSLGRSFWDRQMERDPESYHTPELAAVWYEKKEFVARATLLTDADVFLWCDAGCVRDDATEVAMRSFGLRDASFLNDGTLHFQQIKAIPHKPFYTFPDVRIAGAVLGGNRKAWAQYIPAYDKVLQEYDAAGVCANMDQYVMARLCDQQTDACTLHAPNNLLDPWFFFIGAV